MVEDFNPKSREDRLQSVIAEYIQAVEAGQSPSREELIAQHPDLADSLDGFFHDHDRMHQQADQLLEPQPNANVDPAEALTLAPGEQPASTRKFIRYFGDYELLEEIARGGMGVVYKARQVSLNRIVAVKMILAGQFASPEDVQRFHREAEAAANLDHPNIVPIYEVGEHEGQHYFSMKLIEGGSLAQRLSADEWYASKTEQRKAAELLTTVARAVHHAHQRGVLHRDLKPGNILIDPQGTPYVTDFGLAKRVEADARQTRTGAIVGTPSYMAPEQARSEKVPSTAVDVYSLGAVLYEMLTGRPPFKAETPLDTVLQVLDREPEPPQKVNPQIDRDLDTICLKCLEKDSGKRYGSAEAVAEELERWLNGEPILARPIGRMERTWRWCRRNPAVASLLAAVAATVLLGTAISCIFAIQANANAKRADEKATEAETNAALATENAQRADQKAGEAENNARLARTNEQQALRQKHDAEQQRDRADWLLYAQQIALAQSEWEGSNLDRAREILNGCRRDFRGWEHAHLLYLLNRKRRVLDEQQLASYLAVAISPDGKRIVTCYGGRLQIMDTASGQKTLSNDNGIVSHVSFSPDGKLVLGDGPAHVIIWDPSTGKKNLTIKKAGPVHGLSFSPDGKRIVCNSQEWLVSRRIWGGMIEVWDATTGYEILAIKEGVKASPVAFSPDGKQIVSGGLEKTLRIWDVATGKEIVTFKGDVKGDAGAALAVAYSPDGKQVVCSTWDGAVKVWDASTGQEIRTLKAPTPQYLTMKFESVAYSLDGKRVVAGRGESSPGLQVWDAATGQEIVSLNPHINVTCFALHPDGTHIVFGTGEGSLEIWDATTGQEAVILQRLEAIGSECGASFSPDAKFVISGSFNAQLTVWDVSTGQKALTLRGAYHGYFSPDGKRIAGGSSGGTLKVWDAATGREALVLKGYHVGPAFTPDGKHIVGGSFDRTLTSWNARTGQQLFSRKEPSEAIASWSLSSAITRHYQDGSYDSVVPVWNSSRTRMELLKRKRPPRSVPSGTVPDREYDPLKPLTVNARRNWNWGEAFSDQAGRQIAGSPALSLEGRSYSWPVLSPEGNRILSQSLSGALRICDVATDQVIRTLSDVPRAASDVPGGRFDQFIGLAFSDDGRQVAGTSGDLSVWDTATGKKTFYHQGRVGSSEALSLAFSPDGKRLVSGSSNGALTVSDLSTGKDMLNFKGHTGNVFGVAFSPDGKRIVSGCSWDGTVKVWDATTGEKLLSCEVPLMGGAPLSLVESVGFSPDGEQILCVTLDRMVKFWNETTGHETLTLHTFPILAFSPDGKRFVNESAEEGTLKVCDATTGQQTLTLKGPGQVACIAYSGDGKHIAGAFQVNSNRGVVLPGQIIVWDAVTAKQVLALKGQTGLVASIAFSPDGRRLVSGGDDGTLRIWETNTGQETFTAKCGPIMSVSFSSDGRRILTAGEALKVWE
jgi:WD40 repeat protein